MTGTPRYRKAKLKEFLLYPLRRGQAHTAQLGGVPERLPFPQQPDKPRILHRLRLMALDAALAPTHLHPFRLSQLPALVQSVPDVLPFHFSAEAEARHIYRRYAANLAVLAEQGQVLFLKIHIDPGIYAPLDEFKNLPNRPADPAQLADEHYVNPFGHGIVIRRVQLLTLRILGRPADMLLENFNDLIAVGGGIVLQRLDLPLRRLSSRQVSRT